MSLVSGQPALNLRRFEGISQNGEEEIAQRYPLFPVRSHPNGRVVISIQKAQGDSRGLPDG